MIGYSPTRSLTGVVSRQSGSVSPNKQRRETSLGGIASRRQSAAIQTYNSTGKQDSLILEEHQRKLQDSDLRDEGEIFDGASIFNKFKKQFGEVNKRPGFMQIVKMDSQMVSENGDDGRHGLIMTPNNTKQVHPGGVNDFVNQRPSELDQSKGDLSNNSHYYRFKRHSHGYQS